MTDSAKGATSMRNPRRLSIWAVLAVVGLAVPAVASATGSSTPDGTRLTPTSTHSDRLCDGPAATAGSGNGSTCEVRPAADPGTGHVSSETTLISPLDGWAPWTNADAYSEGDVVATYDLTSPVKKLDFTVDIHVNQASLAVRDLPPYAANALHGNGFSNAETTVFPNMAEVDVVVTTSEPQCPDYSGTRAVGTTSQAVLTQWQPGTATRSGQDYVLTVPMACSSGEIPAGQVVVRAGVDSWASEVNGPGSDSAAIDGVVTGIYVTTTP